MPNPKAGTVSDDVARAIRDVKQGKIEFKMDKQGNLHVVIGKVSFQPQQLRENAQAVIDAILRARPGSVKGRFIKTLTLSSTMSPGIPLSLDGLESGTPEDTV